MKNMTLYFQRSALKEDTNYQSSLKGMLEPLIAIYGVCSYSPFWKSWGGEALAVRVGEAMKHEADHGQGHHGLGDLR